MLEIVLSGTTFILTIFLGLLVFYRNPKNLTNQLFFFLTFLINTYIIINYLSLHPPTPNSQLFWIRLVMFITSFIGPTLLLLVLSFPKGKITVKKYKLILLFLLCFTSATASLSSYVFTSLQFSNGKPVPTPGPAIPIFFLDFVGLFFLSFILIILKYRKSSGIEKIQFFYFLCGIIGTFSLMGITTVIFVVILKFSGLVFLGPISALCLITFVAYAIIKYRFLDIRPIVAKSVAFLVLLITFGGFYSSLLLFIGSTFFKVNLSLSQFVFSGAIAFFIAFTFQPLRRTLERITDRLFYKDRYDTQHLLHTLSGTIASVIDLQEITNQLLTPLLANLRITRGAFVLLKSHDHSEIEFIESKGFDPEINIHKKDVILFLSQKAILLFDELEEGEYKETMRNLTIAAVLPLFAQEEKVGILCFGEKLSGDIYSDQDIQLLQILQPELSVAIQNAREFEEIKRFNITLKEEVEKATKDLQAANERLKVIDKLKDEFVSLASHELRTPMTSIKSYIWMLMDPTMSVPLGPLTEKQKVYLDRIYKSTERLITLVNDMLSVSRIESGRLVITKKPLPIVDLAKSAVNDVLPTAKENKLTITVQEPDHPLPNVFADEEKIKQVLINLIGNALKFTPENGSITISFQEKNHEEENDQIAVSVKDTGKGIKQEDMGKLFTKFSMIEGNYDVRSQSKGTGLGLYICKSIVELHGGHISVSSEGENKGATFTFTLPVAK